MLTVIEFESLYRANCKKLIHFAMHMVPREVAEDIIADSFIRVYTSAERYNDPDFVLTATVKRLCINYVSKHRRREEIESMISADAITSYQFNADLIVTMIDKLPNHKWRKILSLKYKHGYKNAEIASELRLSEKTVRNNITFSLKYLKKLFIQ